MSTNTRAAIYARISRDKAATEVGVQDQERDCRAYALQHGYTVAAVLVDNDTSAMKDVPRPGFDQLVELVRAGGCDVVIVRHVDRLYRRVRDLEAIVKPFNDSGVPIVAVQSGRIDLATADGRLHAGLLAQVAQHESEVKAERVSAHARNRAHKGIPTSSSRPFGWQWAPGGGVEPHPQEGPAVARAYAMLLEGESLSGIARWLDGQGFTSTGGAKFAQSRVSTILRNPRNAGMVAYKGEVVASAVDGHSLVDRATFDRAQAILADPSRSPRRNGGGRPAGSMLTGVASCGTCGKTLVAATNRARDNSRYPTYECLPHRHVSRSRAKVDQFARVAVGEFLQANRAVLAAELAAQTRGGAGNTKRLAALRKQLEGLTAQVSSLAMSPALYAAAATPIEREITELEQASVRASTSPELAKLLTERDLAGVWAAASEAKVRKVMLAAGLQVVVPARRGAMTLRRRPD